MADAVREQPERRLRPLQQPLSSLPPPPPLPRQQQQ
jgi:hypothetical protein